LLHSAGYTPSGQADPAPAESAESPVAELPFEDSILPLEILDDIPFVPVDPACDRHDEEVARLKNLH